MKRNLRGTIMVCGCLAFGSVSAFGQSKELADYTLTNRTGKWDVVISEYPSAATDTTGTPAMLSFSPNGVYRLWVKGDTTFRQSQKNFPPEYYTPVGGLPLRFGLAQSG